MEECTVDKYSKANKSPSYCPICDLPSEITGHTIDMLVTIRNCKRIDTSLSGIDDYGNGPGLLSTSTLKPLTKDTKIIPTTIGKTVTLKCAGSSGSGAQDKTPNKGNLIWKKNNKKIDTINDNMRFSITVNGDLQIKKVQVGDAGQYACIRNSTDYGFDSTPFFVNVTDAPTSQSFRVKSYSSTIMNQQVNGNKAKVSIKNVEYTHRLNRKKK